MKTLLIRRFTISPRRDKYFTLDPNFPSRLIRSGKRRTINCISFLFQEFSKRSLTVLTDRCVALSGLEARISEALNCRRRYGILEKYLHRNLLWLALDGDLTEITYDHHVPSWSWMAYIGGIQFRGVPLGGVEWYDYLQFDKRCECEQAKFTNLWTVCKRKHAIVTNLWTVLDLPKVFSKAQHADLDFDGAEEGWINYDLEGGEDSCEKRCIVVGRLQDSGVDKYYVLVVRSTSVNGEYRRIGLGLIQSKHVERQVINVRVV